MSILDYVGQNLGLEGPTQDKPRDLRDLGEFTSTSYGPPWDAMQGSGTTATGIDLHNNPKRYIIAVDPSIIPLGSIVRVTPNPVGAPLGMFLAADTGGAITGKHIDFYDWRGRGSQSEWGVKRVRVQMVKEGHGSANDSDAQDPTYNLHDHGTIQDADNAAKQGISDAADAVEAVPEFLGRLGGAIFSREFWWRVFKIVVGLGLTAIAVHIILKSTGIDSNIPKVIPV